MSWKPLTVDVIREIARQRIPDDIFHVVVEDIGGWCEVQMSKEISKPIPIQPGSSFARNEVVRTFWCRLEIHPGDPANDIPRVRMKIEAAV